VATQDDTLRQKHYHGLPEMAMNYFKFIAQEAREIMAQLGVTRLVDLIGRTDLLEMIEGKTSKQSKLDLSGLLAKPNNPSNETLYCSAVNTSHYKGELNELLLSKAQGAIESKTGISLVNRIRNTDRSVGAMLSGYIASLHGNQGMAADPISIELHGTAGQSFGVWNAGGLEMTLVGDANDYVGKGMAGGKLVIRPPLGSSFESHQASIVGNTCLYGATGGKLFAAGKAGERFAVRNSGVTAVVEGLGDNGCEYMTGGVVCVLGNVGINFGAGMTGGFAYVLDERADFEKRINPELVEIVELDELNAHQEHLRGLIAEHLDLTGSTRAEQILSEFELYLPKFKLVKPISSDVKSLLGHRARSSAELRVQAQ
jgi:glutamate synthase (NADPH/NADH) large chain